VPVNQASQPAAPTATTTAGVTTPTTPPPTTTAATATAVPSPTTTPPAEPAQATAEAEDWNLAQSENTREGYEAYLRRYRRGLHAREARNAIAELNRLSPTVPAVPGATTTTVAGATPGTPGSTAAGATPTASPGTGRVMLNIRPWGQVFVDGAERGVSPPLKSLSLRPGIYNIEVRNGDLDVYRQRVTVQDSRSAPVVSHEFK
jgi:non-specific serine/threonine protein kinase